MTGEPLGFIGLGNMGGAVAGRINGAGYAMVVYDIRAEAADSHVQGGARLAANPAEVARSRQIALSPLPGPAQVEQAALGPAGLKEGSGRGRPYVDPSSSSASL